MKSRPPSASLLAFAQDEFAKDDEQADKRHAETYAHGDQLKLVHGSNRFEPRIAGYSEQAHGAEQHAHANEYECYRQCHCSWSFHNYQEYHRQASDCGGREPADR